MDLKEYSKWISELSINDVYAELRNIELLIKMSKNKNVLETVKTKYNLIQTELEKRNKK